MRVMVLHAHPDDESYSAALHRSVVDALTRAGHQVDDCDLYAEAFDPVMGKAERRGYHDLARNREPVAAHVDRLLAAEALVIVSPVWNFGFPAILKGYFDRVFLPGVSFRIVDGKVSGALHNIGRLTAVMTYGATPLRAFLAGNPPKRIVTRALRAVIKPGARVDFLAHYDMNNATVETRAAFMAKVVRSMQVL